MLPTGHIAIQWISIDKTHYSVIHPLKTGPVGESLHHAQGQNIITPVRLKRDTRRLTVTSPRLPPNSKMTSPTTKSQEVSHLSNYIFLRNVPSLGRTTNVNEGPYKRHKKCSETVLIKMTLRLCGGRDIVGKPLQLSVLICTLLVKLVIAYLYLRCNVV